MCGIFIFFKYFVLFYCYCYICIYLKHIYRRETEQARDEARDVYRAELDVILQEKQAMIADRQRLEDEKLKSAGLIEAATAAKKVVQDLQQKLFDNEDEVIVLKRRIANYEAIRIELDDMHSMEGPHSGKLDRHSSHHHGGAGVKQNLILLKKNAELEGQLASMHVLITDYKEERSKREGAEHNSMQKQCEVDKLTSQLLEAGARAAVEIQSLKSDIARLEAAYQAEKEKNDTLSARYKPYVHIYTYDMHKFVFYTFLLHVYNLL